MKALKASGKAAGTGKTKKTPTAQSLAGVRPAKCKTKSSFVSIASGRRSAEIADVYDELERLAAYIDAAKREIAAISPHDVKDEFLLSATDELDAIIEATATATNTIMDSCELVEGVMGDVTDEVGAKLMDATTSIYEACTFQDITGQRIGKVVTALKNIEDRIDALVLALGDELIAPKVKNKTTKPKSEAKTTLTDADLLEGPQLGAKAKSQAEIDDLLASFD
ncbi:hypothetical protein BEN30_05765 [Magnetovibrio blakemorei]|uniref:Uncharacterized protein n=1 Tax=Magnetovibrio blakemorei TaxID=28181 RepID=A0A1E5QAB4_9PROT|nr:hypothetical protein BEN30_05765 [Magnetovibrio blakemorei]